MTNYFFESLVESHDVVHELWEKSREAKDAIAKAPSVSIDEFINLVEPCDIIVSKVDPKMIKSGNKVQDIKNQMMSRLNSFIQGAPITSSKCILRDDMIIGFGVDPFRPTKVDIIPLKKYLKNQIRAIICRYPKLTEEQSDKILKYLVDKRALDYDKSSILNQLWARLLKGEINVLQNVNLKSFKPHQIEMWKDPLFCSTLLTMAYKYAGIRADFTRKPLEIWPKDFLVSHNLQIVAKYEKGK